MSNIKGRTRERTKTLPVQDVLLKYMSYDKETGIVTWNDTGNEVGKVHNSTRSNPYKKVYFKRRTYMVHRLIWRMVTGEDPGEDLVIDHINHDSLDNRWINLRCVTRSENNLNRKPSTDLE